MTDETESGDSIDTSNYIKIAIIATVAVLILTGITIGAYQYAKKRSSTVVLPGGVTYLGPSNEQKTPTAPLLFSVNDSTPWIEFKGKVYPFSFSHPETLSLVLFPGDTTDSVAVSWGNIPPQQNIMFRVSDLNKTEPQMIEYINKPKIEYVNNWWKQFSGLKGVKTVVEFTNAKGMKGYKAKFINYADQSPNNDVFFEVPNRPDLMVRFGNGSLEESVFDRIIDSFYWNPQTRVNTATSSATQ